jgi:hypothetical protein
MTTEQKLARATSAVFSLLWKSRWMVGGRPMQAKAKWRRRYNYWDRQISKILSHEKPIV